MNERRQPDVGAPVHSQRDVVVRDERSGKTRTYSNATATKALVYAHLDENNKMRLLLEPLAYSRLVGQIQHDSRGAMALGALSVEHASLSSQLHHYDLLMAQDSVTKQGLLSPLGSDQLSRAIEQWGMMERAAWVVSQLYEALPLSLDRLTIRLAEGDPCSIDVQTDDPAVATLVRDYLAGPCQGVSFLQTGENAAAFRQCLRDAGQTARIQVDRQTMRLPMNAESLVHALFPAAAWQVGEVVYEALGQVLDSALAAKQSAAATRPRVAA